MTFSKKATAQTARDATSLRCQCSIKPIKPELNILIEHTLRAPAPPLACCACDAGELNKHLFSGDHAPPSEHAGRRRTGEAQERDEATPGGGQPAALAVGGELLGEGAMVFVVGGRCALHSPP